MNTFQKLLCVVFGILTLTSCNYSNKMDYPGYMDSILKLAGGADSLPYQLSPNGKWLASKMCFSPKDEFYLFDVLETKEYQIDINKDLPKDYRSICGMYWSPDGNSFVALGVTSSPPQKSFIVIFNIDDPSNVQKFVFGWQYNSDVGVEWSPDSSKIIISTDLDKRSFIVDKKGALITDFALASEVSSGTWIGNSHFAEIRNKNNLWITKPEKGLEDHVYTFKTEQLVLGYKPEKNMLLLLSETDGLTFTVFDLSKMKEMGTQKIETPKFDYYHIYTFIATTNPNISGISAHSTFWIFDWKALRVKNFGNKIDPVIWSPILDGFLYAKNFDNDSLLLLKP